MSELAEAQRHFAARIPDLIDHIIRPDRAVRGAEWMRSPEEALRLSQTIVNGKPLGIRNSLHCDRLAIDLIIDIKNLDGTWRLATAPEYEEVGIWWEKTFQNVAWGGRWSDSDHFSWPFGGRR